MFKKFDPNYSTDKDFEVLSKILQKYNGKKKMDGFFELTRLRDRSQAFDDLTNKFNNIDLLLDSLYSEIHKVENLKLLRDFFYDVKKLEKKEQWINHGKL